MTVSTRCESLAIAPSALETPVSISCITYLLILPALAISMTWATVLCSDSASRFATSGDSRRMLLKSRELSVPSSIATWNLPMMPATSAAVWPSTISAAVRLRVASTCWPVVMWSSDVASRIALYALTAAPSPM